MKKSFVRYSVLIVVIAITISGIFTYALTCYFNKNEISKNAENMAILLSHQINENSTLNQAVDYNKIVKDYSILLNNKTSDTNALSYVMRIMVIDFNGNVLGDSESNNIKEDKNQSDKKEIIEAIQGKIGTDERKGEAMKRQFLYVAKSVEGKKLIIRVSVPLNEIRSINNTFLFYTLIGIIVGLLLTIVISIKVSSIITKPLYQLISTSKEIVNGNYKKRVDIHSQDEIGVLADTFNEMAYKLDTTLSGILNKSVRVDTIINNMRDGIIAVDTNYKIMVINTIACDIFGINYGPGLIDKSLMDIIKSSKIDSFLRDTIKLNTALTDEIIIFSPKTGVDNIYKINTNPIKNVESKDKNTGSVITLHDVTSVKKLEKMRTEFVSNVTHELKTPLTSIRGFVETLKNGAIEDSSVANKFLDIIDIEAERLYMLINDILQLSEIEGMRKDEQVSTNNLKNIIEEVITLLETSADKKNVKIQLSIEEDIVILVNKYRIKQMLINLIDNAIKYNVDNGNILIKANKLHKKIIISIKDSGIGIPEQHQERIFERFYRVDKGRSRNMGGTGLGLSIVKHIVNLYNGDISIISRPGKGTEFIIQLPL